MSPEPDTTAALRRRSTADWPSRRHPQARRRVRAAVAALRSDPERRAALGDCWRALWMSRVLVWVTGVAAALALGRARTTALDLPGLTRGLGTWGDRLLAPAARWDAAWLLAIARHGYGVPGSATASARAAFFPLYPLLVRTVGLIGVPLVVGGVLVSLAAFAAALYGLHRLTALELRGPGDALSPPAARNAVFLAAFFPTALFFSAVYTESLYLALSVGVFWCARQGRWAAAGALGALAAATRNTGVLLLLGAAMLYLYGPRADRPPDAPAAHWRPRYRVRRDVLWLGLIPAGLVAYAAFWLAHGGSVLLPVHAQGTWHRHFAPLAGAWRGVVAGIDAVRQLVVMPAHHAYYSAWHGDPAVAATHSLIDLLALLALIAALWGVWRALPAAYGVYALAVLAVGLSEPVTYEPLMSLPRFAAVLFPFYMWAGARLVGRPRMRTALLGASALLMAVFLVQFATWHWVA